MRSALIIAKRELATYFGTPLAYVFAVIFVALTGAFAFYIGNYSSSADRLIYSPSSPIIRGFTCCWCQPSRCGCGPRRGKLERSSS